MGNPTRTSGIVTMITGGIMQVAAIMFIALIEEPFPMALILVGGGVLLFLIGGALFDRRSDHSHQSPRLPSYSGDI